MNTNNYQWRFKSNTKRLMLIFLKKNGFKNLKNTDVFSLKEIIEDNNLIEEWKAYEIIFKRIS